MELINRILYNLLEVHPLHALVVHFPVALVSAGLFFVLLALWRSSDTLEQIAFANIALASVGTLAAGVTGWMDNVNIYDGTAPNYVAKAALATLLFIITSFTTLSRWRNPDLFHSRLRMVYIAGYFSSFLIVSVLGFLGGVILYGFHEVPNGAAIIPVTGGSVQVVQAQESLPADPPATVVPGVSFSGDILPILKSRCVNCHGGKKTEEGLDLTSYEALMAGSENGPVLSAGDADSSVLIQSLLEGKMPKRGVKLTPEQVQLFVEWVEAGALKD
ncbi:MAG: hypothetical protein HUU11_16390 [Anaerolineales bacterium]|nr:hypothetical protein [Anaerolineales bacterium]